MLDELEWLVDECTPEELDAISKCVRLLGGLVNEDCLCYYGTDIDDLTDEGELWLL